MNGNVYPQILGAYHPSQVSLRLQRVVCPILRESPTCLTIGSGYYKVYVPRRRSTSSPRSPWLVSVVSHTPIPPFLLLSLKVHSSPTCCNSGSTDLYQKEVVQRSTSTLISQTTHHQSFTQSQASLYQTENLLNYSHPETEKPSNDISIG